MQKYQIALRSLHYQLIICLLFFAVASSNPNIAVKGYIQQLLISSPYYSSYPGRYSQQWLWDQWHGGSKGGHTFYPEYDISGWGGTRAWLNFTVGDMRDTLYLNVPFIFSYDLGFQKDKAQLKIQATSVALLYRGDPFSFSYTDRRYGLNTPWEFKSLGDPLGALKLIGTPYPLRTFKVEGQLPGNWNILGFQITDDRCSFFPSTETIPQKVIDELGEMIAFDEAPHYYLLRATRLFEHNHELGLLWGLKQAVNIIPRDTDRTDVHPRNVRTTNEIGFSKTNLGLDLKGELPVPGKPKYLLAAVFSAGDWFKYRKVDGQQSLPATRDSLGRLTGNALKIQIDEFKIGSAILDTMFIKVDPDFQWVAVRDSRYAHSLLFLDPDNPSTGNYVWRAIRDDRFLLRDPAKKADYISDVATYLGLSNWKADLVIPKEISFLRKKKQTLFFVGIANVENLGQRPYLDPDTWIEIIKGYEKVSLGTQIDLSQNTKLGIFGTNKFFESKEDFKRDFGLTFDMNLNKMTTLEGIYSKAWRLQRGGDFDFGSMDNLKIALKGISQKGTKIESSLDFRAGDYDSDLVYGSEDRILGNQYNHMDLVQYIERSSTFSVGTKKITLRLAGEAKKRISTLEGTQSGISLIGYIENRIPVADSLTTTITMVGVKGPEAEFFSSDKYHNLIDMLFLFRPFKSKNTTLSLRCTQRYLPSGPAVNWWSDFRTSVSGGRLIITYGARPNVSSTTWTLGTIYDGRFQPDRELIYRPWGYWGEESVYSYYTRTNYVSLNLTFNF